MPQRQRAAVGVNPLRVHAEFPDADQRLRGKGLVQFNDLHILQRKPGPFQHLGHGVNRADAHDFRRAAAHGKADQPGQRLHAQRLSLLAAHQHHKGGAVAHLGGSCRRD